MVDIFIPTTGIIHNPMGFFGEDKDYSCDLERGSDMHFEATFPSGGDRRQWTLALWLNLESNPGGSYEMIFTRGVNSAENLTMITGDKIRSESHSSGGRRTSATYTDTGVWHHYCWVADFDQAAAADRLEFWYDGTKVTSYSPDNASSQADSGNYNTNGLHTIFGHPTDSSASLDGKVAEVHYIDGQALDPTSFITGTPGNPKKYSGSYGTTGYQLLFKSSGDLGNDSSGNGNDWSPQNSPVQSEENPWP